MAGPPKTTQLEALHGLARALASGEFRARAVLERACAAVAGGFAFQRVGIVRFLPDTSTLVPFAGHGLTMDEIRALPPALPVGNFGAFARALAMRRAVYVEDPSTEEAVPEQIARDFGLGSFVIVPLSTDGRCLGFMTCDQRAERFLLDEAEVDLLTTFGTLIAGFLEKAIEHGELRRLNELKSQFIALASHELRTPAGSVYGAIRTLDEREHELTDEQRGELRRMLTQQSARLVDLVDSLLDLSRLEADAIRMVPTEIDVPARLAELAEAVFGDGADLTIDVPDDLRATVDPHAFDRVRHEPPRQCAPARGPTGRGHGTPRRHRSRRGGRGSRSRRPVGVRGQALRPVHAARDERRRGSRAGTCDRAFLRTRTRGQPRVRAGEAARRPVPAGPAGRLTDHRDARACQGAGRVEP